MTAKQMHEAVEPTASQEILGEQILYQKKMIFLKSQNLNRGLGANHFNKSNKITKALEFL